jgi:hypothetical protein
MLVADWDRHADQWRWGTIDTEKAKYYYAIPRDRDQAFFHFNGLLPKLIRLFTMKHVNWFKDESRGLKHLNRKSWSFDKTFLNELDAGMWRRIIKDFQAKVSDSVIEKSVRRLPPEIFAISGNDLQEKLKSRRNTLLENAMKYYRFISGIVHVTGTEENESFVVGEANGSLTVKVFRYKDGKQGAKIYERSFDPKETGVIYLNGLDGKDHFVIEESAASKIKFKIDGGKGSDTYDLKGKIKTEVTDSADEKNIVLHQHMAKLRFD